MIQSASRIGQTPITAIQQLCYENMNNSVSLGSGRKEGHLLYGDEEYQI